MQTDGSPRITRHIDCRAKGVSRSGAARAPASLCCIPVSQGAGWESPNLGMPRCSWNKPQMDTALLHTFLYFWKESVTP